MLSPFRSVPHAIPHILFCMYYIDIHEHVFMAYLLVFFPLFFFP